MFPFFVGIQPPKISTTNVTLWFDISVNAHVPFDIEKTIVCVTAQITCVLFSSIMVNMHFEEANIWVFCMTTSVWDFWKVASVLSPRVICNQTTLPLSSSCSQNPTNRSHPHIPHHWQELTKNNQHFITRVQETLHSQNCCDTSISLPGFKSVIPWPHVPLQLTPKNPTYKMRSLYVENFVKRI